MLIYFLLIRNHVRQTLTDLISWISIYSNKQGIGYPRQMEPTELDQQAFTAHFFLCISNNALGLQSRLLQLPPGPFEQALLTDLLKLLHFSPVFPLDPLEQQSVKHEERSTNDQVRALDNTSHLGRNTPITMFLRIHNNKSRYQPGEGIGCARQINPIQQPDIIRPPAESQPQQPRGADTTADSGDNEQRHVLDLVQDNAGGGGLVSHVRIFGQVADAGEGSREDDEAGEQDPSEEGGEDVVQAGNFVEAEEHLHVAGLEGVFPAQARSRPSFGTISRDCPH